MWTSWHENLPHTQSIIQKTAWHALTHRAAASDTYPLELTPRICKRESRSSWNYALVHLHSRGISVHLFTWKQSTYSLFYYRKQHMAYPARVPINHLKLLKDSAGKSVPGTRNSSLAQEKHGVCEFLHMTAFNILISNFCNTENSVKWLTSQSFRKLTAYPKTLQESQPLLELRTVHLHSRRVNVTLLHMKMYHMLILSYS